MNVDAATIDRVTASRRQRKRRWRVAVVAIIFGLAVVAVVLRLQPAPPRFELMTTDEYQRRTRRFAFIQDARAWMTRFSPKIFGFAPVHISASYRQMGRREQFELSTPLPQPKFSTNDLRVWILTSNDVALIERSVRSENTSRWRVSTAEGIPSVLATGPGSGTLEFASHPKTRGGNVDLAARLRLMSVIRTAGGFNERTNCETVFRIFLKRDEGAIILDESGVLFVWAYAPQRQ